MVGRDGAAHVSKPARILPGVSGVGAGDGLLARTGPVGFGVGFGVGSGVALRVGLGLGFGVGLGLRVGVGADLGVDLGVGLGVGLKPDGEDAGVLGGVSQDAPGPVSASALGQAGFLAVRSAAARTMTGCRVLRIESAARSGPACVAAACVAAAGRTVASICSVAPGPVPYVAPIDGALSGIASASSCRSGSWTIVPGLSACWPPT